MINILGFEGPDKVGKSKLIRALNRATDYQHLCIDRFLGSAMVYDAISERREREAVILAAEEELAHLACAKVVSVLVSCERAVLLDRIYREDEEPEARAAKLDEMIANYDHYRRVTRLPLIEVDTTHATVDGSVQEIIGKLATI
ncbi:MAG TPA: hypothetical protein VLF60_02925 [Candidatus Saccharimonadales bacterium]|nr:hypothetical protein [Candidatus Saccharimonadales bacterium]